MSEFPRVFIKDKGKFISVWVEDWNSDACEMEVVSEAKVMRAGDGFLIDDIETPYKFRRKGYASAIVNKLLSLGKRVEPIGVLNNPDAKAFWAKFGMKDGLGEEE